MLEPGFYEVPRGHVAAVVTHLQMMQQADARKDVGTSLTLERIEAPDVAWYRALFRRVGAEDWLWFSRLVMDETELNAVLSDAAVHIYVLRHEGRDEGLLELDFRENGECELAFFGVSGTMIGTGAGRWMMNRAISLAWSQKIERFHVHTCTLDHPAALDFYVRSGFAPYKREVEIAPDPRVSGVLSVEAAPQVPILR